MAVPRRTKDGQPRTGRKKKSFRCWTTNSVLTLSLVILLGTTLPSLLDPRANLSMETPIFSGNLSPVIFVCCQSLYGEEGNQGELARSLYRDHPKGNIPVDVRYLNAPCFNETELSSDNPKERGGTYPLNKTFPSRHLATFRERIAEVYRQGGIVLAESNCRIPQAEVSNVWLEAMVDPTTGVNGTVNEQVRKRFLLQDKYHLRRILVAYGFEQYVPNHYQEGIVEVSDIAGQESVIEYPVVLKREKSEGGVGVYICHSWEDVKKSMERDMVFETTGMRHQKSRHRTIGSSWVLEEFLPGATQELIVYLRPRGSRQGETYFWCGSHSNERWRDDGNFVKGYADIVGTITTVDACNRHPELLGLVETVLRGEGIYGTGCINYKYGKDGMKKVHDWNLRTCATMSNWNKGKVFLDIIDQIPRRKGSEQLALYPKIGTV